MANHEEVAKLLDKSVPRVYTRVLSLFALLEELTENGGGIVISIMDLMGDEPTTAAYVSFSVTVVSFLIETGRMLGKIYKQYQEKPCERLGVMATLCYRRVKCIVFCCSLCYTDSEAYPDCCICPLEEEYRDSVEVNLETSWQSCYLNLCCKNRDGEDQKKAEIEVQ